MRGMKKRNAKRKLFFHLFFSKLSLPLLPTRDKSESLSLSLSLVDVKRTWNAAHDATDASKPARANLSKVTA